MLVWPCVHQRRYNVGESLSMLESGHPSCLIRDLMPVETKTAPNRKTL